MSRPTIGTLLQQLVAEELVPGLGSDAAGDGETQLVRELHELRRQAPTPWFVRVLIGLGAWVASLLLIGFLAMAEIIESEEGALIGGVVLSALALVARRALGRRPGDFAGQGTLALGLAGQALAIVGCGVMLDSAAAGAALAMILGGLFLVLCPDRIQQFLAALVCGFALAVLLDDLHLPRAIDASALILGSIAGWLWVQRPRLEAGRWGHLVAPAAYGLVTTVLCLLLTSLGDLYGVQSAGWPATVGFTAALLLLARQVRRELVEIPAHQTLVVTAAAAVLLGLATLKAPGVTAAIAALVLAFLRRSTLLMGLALVFLPVFGVAFYYHLQITLLAKSGVLVASGAVLLVLRFLLLRLRESWP